MVVAWLMLLSPTAAVAQDQFGTGTRWIEIPIDQPAASAASPLFGRVNSDTSADLVLYDYARGQAYVAISDGTRFGRPALYSSGLPQFSELTFETALTDVNGDGLDDLVIMNHGADDVPGAATAMVALNTGSGFSYPPQPTWNASWCASYQRCLADDINGDGMGDLVAFTTDGGSVWGTLSTGTSFGANAVWLNFYCIRGEICVLGDVNGDGLADAILFKPTDPDQGEKGNVLWARSTGSAFVDVQYGHGFFCIEAERCLVGDVNGDGRSDVVLVKGFGSGLPTLEVLVSLSNGQQFINAEPFAWANPPSFNPGSTSFGTFGLADVTGDGRADLVEWGLASAPTPGGGSQTTGFAVDVFPTGQPGVPPAPGAPVSPPEQRGYSSVAIYNCETDQHQLFYWNLDSTSGAVEQSGLTDAMYSEAGT
ncbi:MAG: VCBS repeat-containing protein [Chloroflexota bacterium]|nr:VCBS repeat-containing protein [Chloroflexota bacterium]